MIHISRGANSLGAFPEEEVREGLRTGRFTLTDLGWRDGMPSWKPLSQFPELGGEPSPPAPSTAAAQAAPSAPPPQSAAAPTTVSPVPTSVAKTEPLAIWSLVLSVLSLVCCGFILGIPAVICGHLALSKFQREPHLQGKGLAIAGLVIGYVAVAFWLIYVVFFGGLTALRELTHAGSR